MLVSQTFRGGPKLDEEGFMLLQKWYKLTNTQKHEIIREVLADGLNKDQSGHRIREELRYRINKAVPDTEVTKLQY